MSTLVALLDGREVGVVRQASGRLSFQYEDSWRNAPGAYPLSLSLPLAASEHGHTAISAFLWGLLPDNELILERWASRFHVSPRNPFALLRWVGEDCAGAVQLISPERVKGMSAEPPDEIETLTEVEIAARLRELQSDVSAWRARRDIGQFSLAGAQPKTALHYDGQSWGVPSGRTPTTHILKPPSGEFDGHIENEHICLAVARALGLPAAQSEVRTFEDVSAIVVERYDRVRIPELAAATAARAAVKAAEAATYAASETPESAAMAARAAAEAAEASASAESLRVFGTTTKVYRVHQEDFCQALGRMPTQKYQSDGGPGPVEVAELLRAAAYGGTMERETGFASAAGEDVNHFVDALIFNWLIGGTDGHAKNYSILIGAGGLVRLAPLYDLASILPFPGIDIRKVRLAMKIGGKYRLHRIHIPEWNRLATEVRLERRDAIAKRIRTLAEGLPDTVSAEVERAKQAGLSHPILPRMVDAFAERARVCLQNASDASARGVAAG